MKLQEKITAQWVTERNGQIGWQDDGTVTVELKGIRGTGPCLLRAVRDWQKQRRRVKW